MEEGGRTEDRAATLSLISNDSTHRGVEIERLWSTMRVSKPSARSSRSQLRCQRAGIVRIQSWQSRSTHWFSWRTAVLAADWTADNCAWLSPIFTLLSLNPHFAQLQSLDLSLLHAQHTEKQPMIGICEIRVPCATRSLLLPDVLHYNTLQYCLLKGAYGTSGRLTR
jgi:hypothetical protein